MKNINALRRELNQTIASYDDFRKMLGMANRTGTPKSHIFRKLNTHRATILNLMLEIRIELAARQPLDELLDQIAAKHTAFSSYTDLLANTGDHYSPSMCVRNPELKFLADHFDKSSELLGKKVRAYRYGMPIFESDRA